MSLSLCSAVMFVMLMLAMMLSASSTSLSSRTSPPTNTLENPDLSVHNILPSYRTEGTRKCGLSNNYRPLLLLLLLFRTALCLKKVPTFKLSVSLLSLNRFSNFLHSWKAYEICDIIHRTLPTSP